ncbi:MAG: hypothetical protein QW331_01905 [Candidatus Woesearchaeota archaeon]
MVTRREIEEKRVQRNKTLMGVFIIVIMVASTIGFFYGEQTAPSKTDYNEYKFNMNKEQKWVTKINEQEFDFWYHPAEVDAYEAPDEIIELFRGKQAIIFTFIPNSTDIQFLDAARFELATNFGKKNIYVRSGVLEKSDVYKLPIIDCINATPQIPVLKVVPSDEPTFTVENNCAILSATEQQMLRRIESLQYKLLGVIK